MFYKSFTKLIALFVFSGFGTFLLQFGQTAPMSTSDIVAVTANLALTLSLIVAVIFGIVQVQLARHDRKERLTLETLRTLAPEDAYACGAGYRSTRSSVVVDIHAEFGEVGRQTVTPARAGVEMPRKLQGYTVQLGAR